MTFLAIYRQFRAAFHCNIICNLVIKLLANGPFMRLYLSPIDLHIYQNFVLKGSQKQKREAKYTQ